MRSKIRRMCLAIRLQAENSQIVSCLVRGVQKDNFKSIPSNVMLKSQVAHLGDNGTRVNACGYHKSRKLLELR